MLQGSLYGLGGGGCGAVGVAELQCLGIRTGCGVGFQVGDGNRIARYSDSASCQMGGISDQGGCNFYRTFYG